ncbi:YdbL family protein [Oleiharenicola sp. Vm1]|uniref:YdbL family protein n=1 Tax=Oleiharenicola sp. Vm1 TaxID=3398393 RepID=UPI0039F473DC
MIARILAACLALCALTLTVSAAESAAAIRQRMEQRLPQLDDLKARGAIGENNRGFVEVRAAAGNAAALVADENRDREAVYALIAQQTGATAESVGRARAKQIAANARSGVWVQDEGGAWKKK